MPEQVKGPNPRRKKMMMMTMMKYKAYHFQWFCTSDSEISHNFEIKKDNTISKILKR
jgi:hypothetical protein